MAFLHSKKGIRHLSKRQEVQTKAHQSGLPIEMVTPFLSPRLESMTVEGLSSFYSNCELSTDERFSRVEPKWSPDPQPSACRHLALISSIPHPTDIKTLLS